MATRVSMSGGWISAVRPHSKRETRRVSRFGDLAGRPIAGEHDLFMPVEEVLKVWKNSSCERSLPARNWMSSISSTSAWR